MTGKTNDITVTGKEEAEERNGREAEVVQATDFQSVISEFESRHGYKLVMENWYKEKKKIIARKATTFNCVATTNIIGGRDFSRLSVLQR